MTAANQTQPPPNQPEPDAPQPEPPIQTQFARLIAANPIESELHEVLLARVLGHVACDDGRTPTLAERAFIERFIPRVETPIDELAKDDIPGGAIAALDPGRQTTIMAIALVVAMLDGSRGVNASVLVRIAAATEIPVDRLADAEAAAREFVIEQRFEALYAHGLPTADDREATFASLRSTGASEATLTEWDARYLQLAADRPDTDGDRKTAFRARRHANFIARHDPTSKAHRGPGAVSVFGSS